MEVFIQLIIYYIVAINILTFFTFGWDKYRARTNSRRVPEKALWWMIAIGGSLGALAGMEIWKHKRRKASFVFVVAMMLAGQAIIIYFILKKSGIV